MMLALMNRVCASDSCDSLQLQLGTLDYDTAIDLFTVRYPPNWCGIDNYFLTDYSTLGIWDSNAVKT